VSKAVKNAASNWYRAVDTLSHDNWQLPKTLDLESFKKQFMTTYKHLVLNGGEIYEEAVNERTRRDVDGFTRRIANVLIETLRNITVHARQTDIFRSCMEKYNLFCFPEPLPKHSEDVLRYR
jgi:hypothetical protein